MPTPEADDLDWDVDEHGRMRDYATDDEPETVRYELDDVAAEFGVDLDEDD